MICLKKIKKGDIVGRISYGKDILFEVERIIKTTTGQEIAILKGITIRIQADSNIEDLELVEREIIEENEKLLSKRVERKILNCEKKMTNIPLFKRSNKVIYTGKILHLDGDSCLDNKNSLLA